MYSLLAMGEWLTAAVAVTKGVNFDQRESRNVASWTILSLVLITLSSQIHAPVHRQLIDDVQEDRTWCLVQYSQLIEMYNYSIRTISFLMPFAIN